MELSLPAGNLQCAVTAFENGADSVYFGLKSFSARAGAGNFSEDDYRKIREYALANHRKIYITLNTIVTDADIPQVIGYLSLISLVGCDGLLVQDYGVVRLAKRLFPSIPLHASTQMAVQNADGVKALKALGFERVVLARELSLDEIGSIRRECPDVELKVFVHGALCYSVSGLCYASRFLTGKGSANRGSCAQVCRMKFRDAGGGFSSPFSLCDLMSDRDIMRRLAEIGVDSVKVEGRLKGPEYVKWATRYYRALMDCAPEREVAECRARMQSAFSRKTSFGFLKPSPAGISLSGYQGHRGSEVGKFVAKGVARLLADVRPHDGLMYIDGRGEAVKFANSLGFVKRGMPYAVKGAGADAYPVLYRIKDSRDNPESFDSARMEPWRMPLHVSVSLSESSVSVRSEYASADYAVQVSRSDSGSQDLAGNFRKAFGRKSAWCRLADISVANATGFADAETFVPLSALKRIAVAFYGACDASVAHSLSMGGRADASGVSQAKSFKGKADVVLSPVVFGASAPDADFFKGESVEVNNISQLFPFATAGSAGIPGTAVVIGPYFNVANMEAVRFFSELLGDSLKGVWSFPEGGVGDGLLAFVMDGTQRRDSLPAFIHRNSGGGYVRVAFRMSCDAGIGRLERAQL